MWSLSLKGIKECHLRTVLTLRFQHLYLLQDKPHQINKQTHTGVGALTIESSHELFFLP